MTTDEYLDAIHLILVESPIVASYQVIRQRLTSQSGHLRVRVSLINGDWLEAAEFFRLTPDGIRVVDYRHQWMDDTHTLRKRWDSTPHYPDMRSAPYHCHEGDEHIVTPSQAMSIQDVLIILEREIGIQA
jgi:hypothetical protein